MNNAKSPRIIKSIMVDKYTNNGNNVDGTCFGISRRESRTGIPKHRNSVRSPINRFVRSWKRSLMIVVSRLIIYSICNSNAAVKWAAKERSRFADPSSTACWSIQIDYFDTCSASCASRGN